MPLAEYGVLVGNAVAARRENSDDTPHYQVQLRAAGTSYRIAINVKSSVAPSELLYLIKENFGHPILARLADLQEGFATLPSQPGGWRSTSSAATCSTAARCASCRTTCRAPTTI